jgi:hypothetical protein
LKTLLAIALLIATGCSSEATDNSPCSSLMDRTVIRHGLAEDVFKTRGDNYQSEAWWYWTQGYSIHFQWGEQTGGRCSTIESTFTPTE